MKNKIRVFVDYPLGKDNLFKGLVFPQLLANYLNKNEDIVLIKNNEKNELKNKGEMI